MNTIGQSLKLSWADMTPKELEAMVERKVEEKLAPIEEKLDLIMSLLHKFEGASTVIKVLFFAVAPLVAALVWLKDHVKL